MYLTVRGVSLFCGMFVSFVFSYHTPILVYSKSCQLFNQVIGFLPRTRSNSFLSFYLLSLGCLSMKRTNSLEVKTLIKVLKCGRLSFIPDIVSKVEAAPQPLATRQHL